MELDPEEYPAKVTTTAEAIWALAGLPERIKAKSLLTGLGSVEEELGKLWKGLAELVKRQQHTLNSRHLAWYLLATTSWQDQKPDGTGQVSDAVLKLLRIGQQEDGIWPDDPERDHEIYATWLCTWSLLQAYAFLSPASGNAGASSVREQALEAVKKSLHLFKRYAEAPGFEGFAFSIHGGTAKQPGELEPNPAMTAYVLSLLGEAQHLVQDLDLSLAINASVAALFARQGDTPPSVWDSYREPQRPGSKDSDFEHFTTCWVARALWLALSVSQRAARDQRKIWFRALSRAIKGLVMELYVPIPGGLFYVDIGAPRDFSFASSDALGLFNSLAHWQIHFEGDEDEKLARLMQIGQIEEDFDITDRQKEIFDRYSGIRGIIDSLDHELEKKRLELAELAEKRNEEALLVMELNVEKERQKSNLAELDLLIASSLQDVESIESGVPFRWIWLGRPLNALDAVAALLSFVGVLTAFWVQIGSFVGKGNPNVVIAGIVLGLGIAGFAFFAGSWFYEAFGRVRRNRHGPFFFGVMWLVSGGLLHWQFFRTVLPNLDPPTFFQLVHLIFWAPIGVGWKISLISAKILRRAVP